MKRRKYSIISDDGDPCPRCKRPTQIREHVAITAKELRKRFYFSRWFYCAAPDCQTTAIISERFKVLNDRPRRRKLKRAWPKDNEAAYRRIKAIWLRVPA